MVHKSGLLFVFLLFCLFAFEGDGQELDVAVSCPPRDQVGLFFVFFFFFSFFFSFLSLPLLFLFSSSSTSSSSSPSPPSFSPPPQVS